jgi:phage tail sheath protein FI
MTTTFLHGVEVLQIDTGARPIQTVRSSVIGLIGTAPDADSDKFPINQPVMVTRRSEMQGLGEAGTLFKALDLIYDQAGAVVVVIRVQEGATDAATIDNVVGGIDNATGAYKGVHAFLAAENAVGFAPRVLIAPGFTHQRSDGPPVVRNEVLSELMGIANRLRAVVIADGPNTNDAAAVQLADDFGSDRIYVVDPWIIRNDEAFPASPAVAGLINKVDNERGFWWSPSNNEISGIQGTARAIDFALGDYTSRANLLNEMKIATIIREQGFRLWGNRTLAMDPKYAFLSVRRTADMINESILRGHLWAVDRCITATYLEEVQESVRSYLRNLKARGALLGGDVWVDPELNSPENIANGQVFFDFEFTPPYPAERVTFRSHLVNSYVVDLFR